jgi:hypothetical protein
VSGTPAAALDVSELDFQRQVIELARLFRWRVAHFRAAKTSKGWRTAVQADGAGFPDLVLVRDRIVFAELKAERGRLSPEQAAWLEALGRVPGLAVHVWRPSDLEAIAEVLR